MRRAVICRKRLSAVVIGFAYEHTLKAVLKKRKRKSFRESL